MSALAAALVAAQSEMPKLHKDSEAEVITKKGSKYKYQYLSLDSLLDQVLPVLNRHGLALLQAPTLEDGQAALITRLVHESGEDYTFRTKLPVPADVEAQALGSAITYIRRYALLSALALAPDEDDDGAGAQKSSEAGNARAEERSGPSAPEPHAPASEGFQAPLPATERPIAKGTLGALKQAVESLQKGFPSPDPAHDYWNDVQAFMHEKFGKAASGELTEAEGQALVLEFEKRLIDAQNQERIPFEGEAA